MTFDLYNKRIEQIIQTFNFFREESYVPPTLFYYWNFPIKNIFAHKIFIS